MKYSKEDFSTLTSIPNKPVTCLVHLFLYSLLLMLTLCILALPLAFQLENGNNLSGGAIIFDVFYYALAGWAVWAIMKKYKESKRARVRKLSVDKSGLHYHRADGTTKSILYKQLEKSNEAYYNDINWQVGAYRYSPGYIFGYQEGKRLKIGFYNNNEGNIYIIKNKHELIAHFLHGVKLFNVNLSISKNIFSQFHISPETFEYDKKSHRKFIVVMIALVIVVLIAIYLSLKFQGHSRMVSVILSMI